MGNAQTDSVIATLARVCASHSKTLRRDIGGKHTQSSENVRAGRWIGFSG